MVRAAQPTTRQRNGTLAEDIAAAYLHRAGWQILARNLHLGPDEIDLLALDSGPPPSLVVVEVRGARSARFGAPEERVDRRKVACLYRAMASLRAAGRLPGAGQLPRLGWRVDLIVVDRRPGHGELRHLRAVEPPV